MLAEGRWHPLTAVPISDHRGEAIRAEGLCELRDNLVRLEGRRLHEEAIEHNSAALLLVRNRKSHRVKPAATRVTKSGVRVAELLRPGPGAMRERSVNERIIEEL
jgi:hypothetical protein